MPKAQKKNTSVKDDIKVSVVMVSYKPGPIIWRSIESILTQKKLHELIIVDNGNTAQDQKKLAAIAKEEKRIKIVSGHGNVGFARGCNLGAKQATGNYILLLNPDCILLPDTLTTTVLTMEKYPEVWVAGCRIVNPDSTEQAGGRRNLLSLKVALIEGFKLYKLFPKSSKLTRINLNNNSVPGEPEFVPAISGAFMMIKKENYFELGGMDEGYFFHVEDLDFCLQVQRKDKKILYIPNVNVVHFRSTSEVSSFFIEKHKTNGFIRYFKKNFSQDLFPGLMTLIIAASYFRLGIRTLIIYLQRLIYSTPIFPIQHDIKRANFLKTYSELDNIEFDLKAAGPFAVAGVSGQVGLCIVRRLLQAKQKVIGLYHSKVIDFEHPDLLWQQVDIENGRLDLGNNNIKTLIYTPALWYLPPMLEKFGKQGVRRIICYSSTSLFAKSQSQNSEEKDLVKRLAQSEREIAEKCKKLNIEFTIIRPTLIYGVGFDKNVAKIYSFIKWLGVFLVYSGARGLRQPVHADDLAIASLKMVNNKKTFGKSYDLSGGEKLPYYEMVGRIFDAMGKRRKIISINFLPLLLDFYSKVCRKPDVNGEIAKRMDKNQVFDSSQATKDFGYTPRGFLTKGIIELDPQYK